MTPLFFVEMLRLMFALPQEIINDEIRVTVPPLEGKLEDLLRKPWPPGVRMLGEGRFFSRKSSSPIWGNRFRATLEKTWVYMKTRDPLGVFLSHAIVKVY